MICLIMACNYTVTKKRTCVLYLFCASSLMSDGCHVTKGISWAKCTTCCPVPDPNSRPNSSRWDWSSRSSQSTDSKPSWLRSAAGESSMIWKRREYLMDVLYLFLYARTVGVTYVADPYTALLFGGSGSAQWWLMKQQMETGDYLDKRLLSAPPLLLHNPRTNVYGWK